VRPGDVLVLTKPIGTGILSFAAQIDRAPAGSLDAIGRSMASLNKTSAEIMRQFDARACTDVTGFGLMGHLSAMAAASGVNVEIVWDDVPFFAGVLECAAAGIIPGGIERNRESSGANVRAHENVSPTMLDVLFDPQTSGGLLIAVSERDAPRLVDALATANSKATSLSVSSKAASSQTADLGIAVIGRAVGAGTGKIEVRSSGRVRMPEPSVSSISNDAAKKLDVTKNSESHSQADAINGVRAINDIQTEESTMSDCCSAGHNTPSAAGSHAAGASTGTGGIAGGGTSSITEIQQKFQEFLKAVNKPGALDAHTKQAICLALAVLAKCEPCVRSHVAKAREKGFSAEEIDEAAWLAISFGGAPLMAFYQAIRKQIM
ncbi:MAG: selenide, water dikinase SelD, partial [Phycisphaerae bacterium]|nr:selenide, water dikinase SelD [Phycisphaerae bacterium]